MKFKSNVHKTDITKIGGFIKGRPDTNWVFDGKYHPNSVALVYDGGEILYGGYTVEELIDITQNRFKCTSPGSYDSLMECIICGYEYMKQADAGEEENLERLTHDCEAVLNGEE